MLKAMTVRATIAAILAGLCVAAHAVADSPKRVDIPAGELRQALLQLSEQFGTDLVYSPEQIQGIQTRGAHGELTTEQAVTKLLEGTPLELRTDPSGAMLIASPENSSSLSPTTRQPESEQSTFVGDQEESSWSRLRLAQNEAPRSSPGEGRSEGRIGSDGESDARGARARQRAQRDPVVEEIIVTAQKREQALSDVGISVTAFSGEQLKSLGLTETTQIGEQVPGLMVTGFGGGATTVFTIRGSGQLDFADLHEAPVAVYSDGAYNPYLAGVGFSFFDLDRVEVLRGPQGTLFGRNATGGVVHLISARPTRDFTGYLEATGGEFDQRRFEGAISGPLTDALSGRLSMAYHTNSGFMENLALPGEDGGEVDNNSGRAQLLFEPNEDFSLLLLGHWSIDDTNGQLYTLKPAVPRGPENLRSLNPTLAEMQAYCASLGVPPGLPAAPGFADCFGTPEDGRPFTGLAGQPGFLDREHYGFTSEIEWTVGEVRLTNIANWQELTKKYQDDADVAPAPIFDFFGQIDATNFSEEFRLSWNTDNSNYVIGAYYLNIDSDMRTGAFFDPTVTPFNFDNGVTLETETWAAFGQAEWKFAPAWTVIGGIRWTEDDKDFGFTPTCPNQLGIPGFSPTDCTPFLGPLVAQSNNLSLSRSEGDWSGALGLDWTPNDDWLIYAKVSRGHKAGGYNSGPAATFAVADIEYDGEILWAYEIGSKATVFGGSTRINTSIFYYDYNDFQSFESTNFGIFVGNIDAENIGAEIEIVTNPWEGWEFLLGASVQDAQQKDFVFEGIARDRPMPNAPDLTLNGLTRYDWTAFLGGRMFAQVDFNYVDERSLTAVDHPSTTAEDYFVANARLGWTSAEGQWDAELWVKNFTDETYTLMAFQTDTIFGGQLHVIGPPRWFGATVRYRW